MHLDLLDVWFTMDEYGGVICERERAQSSELFIRREERREGVKASTNSFRPTPFNLFLLEQVIYHGPTNSLIGNAPPTLPPSRQPENELEVILRLGVM